MVSRLLDRSTEWVGTAACLLAWWLVSQQYFAGLVVEAGGCACWVLWGLRHRRWSVVISCIFYFVIAVYGLLTWKK